MLSFPACLFCSQHTSILPSLALRCVSYQVQFIISVSPLTVVWLKLITWEPHSTKHFMSINWISDYYLFICVICARPTFRWLLIIFCSPKRFYSIDFYKPVIDRKKLGRRGWRKELKANLPAKTDPKTVSSVLFSFFHTVGIDGNSSHSFLWTQK